MKLIEKPHRPQFDVSQFVTYTGEEFQDEPEEEETELPEVVETESAIPVSDDQRPDSRVAEGVEAVVEADSAAEASDFAAGLDLPPGDVAELVVPDALTTDVETGNLDAAAQPDSGQTASAPDVKPGTGRSRKGNRRRGRRRNRNKGGES